MANEILLDTGTNEVEILELLLGEQSFGVNVAKVMQIIPYDESKFTAVPDETEATLGVFLWQEKTIPLINLNSALHRKEQELPKRPIVLVTRFNEVTNGFLISSVNRIHRVNWDQIRPTSSILSKYSSNVTGSVPIEGKEILLIDFEYIVAELFPDLKMDHNLDHSDIQKEFNRENMKIVFSEDSAFIRNNVSELLKRVGYNNVQAFENGLDAFNHINAHVKKAAEENRSITDYINLVITDIEMPKMDGLSLCRHIKKELKLSDVPVALFSSLIDEQMSLKCKEVGADVFTTKPQISELINMIDDLLHVN